jgi:hypothetical protein
MARATGARGGVRLLIFASALSVAEPAFAHDFGRPGAGAPEEARTLEAAIGAEPPDSAAAPVLHSFIATRLVWGPGKLAVCFWNGDAALRQKVAAIADELVAGLPVSYEWKPAGTFVTCPQTGYKAYVVRVSLAADASLVGASDDPASYFATIGRAALKDERKATVNLPFPATPSPDLLRSKTLHEFCHTLGCLHEHQRGLCDNDFDKDAILANYPGMTDEEYRKNFLRIPSADAFMRPEMVGDIDLKSIMMYTFYSWMFVDYTKSKCYRPYEVTKLSPRDEEGLAYVYPRGAVATPLSLSQFDVLAEGYRTAAFGARDLAGDIRGRAMAAAEAGDLGLGGSRGLTAGQRQAMQEQLRDRALTLEAYAARYESDAAKYDLRPETRQKLEAALRLLP